MWRWLTPASSPVPCHPADRNSNGASSWVSFGTDGGFVHLVSPPPLLPSMRNCTTCTVHTFAQLVKLCTKGFLTFGLVAVNMHRARCESCTKDECTDWSQPHASALYWSFSPVQLSLYCLYRPYCISCCLYFWCLRECARWCVHWSSPCVVRAEGNPHWQWEQNPAGSAS